MKATVLNKTKLDKKTLKTLSTIYETLARSYGPLGGNTIIHRNGDLPSVTKDGFTILKALRFDSDVEFDIYRLIYTISSSLVDKVGDGSTSSVLSAISLYDRLNRPDDTNINSYFMNNRDMIDTLNLIQKILGTIIELVLTKSIPTDLEKKTNVLTTLATLSNNNNKEIGSALGKILAGLHSDSYVQIKENPQDTTQVITYNYNSGFQLNGDIRVSHPLYFSRNNHKQELDLARGAYVVMSYNFLEVHYNYLLQNVMKGANDANIPVVVIAETVQQEVKTQIIRDAMIALNSNRLPSIVLLEASDLSNIRNLETFSDLEAYLNCNAVKFNAIGSEEMELTNEESLDLVGFAKRITLKTNNSIIFDGGAGVTSEGFSKLTDKLYSEYNSTPVAQKLTRGNLRRRLNRLNGVNATIYVGGRTQEEKENAKYLVEDSVLACMNAIKHGYTLGSNLAAFYSASILLELLTYDGNLCEKITSMIHNDNIGDIKLHVDSLVIDIYKLKDVTLFNSTNGEIYNIVESIKEAYFNVVNIHTKLDDKGVFPSTLVQMNNESILSFFEDDIDSIKSLPVYNVYNREVEKFNLVEEDESFDTSVISPMKTDIEILNSTFAMLTLLLSTNQYIS